MKIRLSQIEITKLNNNCISLVLKFSRVLHAHNGDVLKVSEPQVVKRLFSIAATTDNVILQRLALRLKKEIKMCLLGDFAEESSFQLYEVDVVESNVSVSTEQTTI